MCQIRKLIFEWNAYNFVHVLLTCSMFMLCPRCWPSTLWLIFVLNWRDIFVPILVFASFLCFIFYLLDDEFIVSGLKRETPNDSIMIWLRNKIENENENENPALTNDIRWKRWGRLCFHFSYWPLKIQKRRLYIGYQFRCQWNGV